MCRGQYSDAVLSELESQNDNHLEGMSAKVKMLKDVGPVLFSYIPGYLRVFFLLTEDTRTDYRRYR